MSDKNAIQQIQALLQKVATRIKTQRVFDALATGGTIAVMLIAFGLVLHKTGWFGVNVFLLVCGVSLVIPFGLAAYSWTRRLDRIAVAQKLDRVHGLHDRLSTAVSLAEDPSRASQPWSKSQMEDAERHLNDLDVAKAAPYAKPVDLTPLVIALIALGMLALLKPPSHDHELPQPPEIKHDPVLDSASLALERDKLAELKKQLETLDDEVSKELVEEIDALLDAVENREISEKQFLDKIAELEKKLAPPPEQSTETDDLAEQLKKAAEELEKTAKKELKDDPDAQELVEALKKKDFEGASEALSKLADKLMDKNLSEKDLERLASLMEKFGNALDINDPALQELFKKHQDKLAGLENKMNSKNGLSKKEKEALKKTQDKLAELEKRAQENKEKKRELDELHRASQEIAENAKKITKGGGDKKKANSDEERDRDFYRNRSGRKTKEMSKKMEKKSQEQKRDKAREMAKRQLNELKESMRRSSARKSGKSGESGESKESQERGQKMKEFLDRANGNQPKDGQGEKGSNKDAQPSDRESADRGDGDKPSKKGKKKGKGDQYGSGEGDKRLGKETNLDSKARDEQVKGLEGKGPSKAEVIKATSEEGFANTAYKDMYVEYESVVEEVMDKEKVPPGYRYYIKRYFQMIQPKE